MVCGSGGDHQAVRAEDGGVHGLGVPVEPSKLAGALRIGADAPEFRDMVAIEGAQNGSLAACNIWNTRTTVTGVPMFTLRPTLF